MAYTYDDLISLQNLYGIPPEKSAGAYGVALPPPPVDAPIAPAAPLDLGGAQAPGHPGMLADPGLLAGNEKPVPAGQENWLVDAGGKPVGDIPVAPLLREAPQPNTTGLSDVVARAKAFRDPSKPIPVVSDFGPEAELAAAKKLEAESLGAGAPSRTTMGMGGMSEASAMNAVDKNPALNRAAHDQQTALGDEVAAAQGKEFDARRTGQLAIATALGEAATMAKRQEIAEATRLREEEDRQMRAERELKDAQDRIMAKPPAVETFIKGLASAFSYMLAGAANAKAVAAGGQPTDIIGPMMARADENERQEYARKIAQVKGLKVDAETKDQRVRQLEADKAAAYARRRDNAMDALKGIYLKNEADLTDAQKAIYMAKIDEMTGQKEVAFNQARKDLASKMQAASAAAAQQPGMLSGKTNAEHMKRFVGAGGGNSGFVAYTEEGAKTARTMQASADAMAQSLDAIERDTLAIQQSGWAPTDPKYIAAQARIEQASENYQKQLSVLQDQGVVREWESKNKAIANAGSLIGMRQEAVLENIKDAKRNVNQAVKGIQRIHSEYEADKVPGANGLPALVPRRIAPTQGTFGAPNVSKTR